MVRPVRRLWIVALFALAVSRTALAQAPDPAWVDRSEPPLYVAVRVTDVDRSVEWYRTVFGLQPVGGSAADDGSWRIENLASDWLFVEIVRDDRARPAERSVGFFKVGFRVPDVDAVAARVEVATGERPRALDFPEYHMRVIQIRDPDGHIVQLFSRLEE